MHLVEYVADGFEIFDVRSVGVECAFAGSTGGERFDDKFLSATWMHLERKFVRHRVLPKLNNK